MEKIIIDLTQEQINTMVHDSCVLFCKHCGCGIPRETCTSLGTCKEHDEYRTAIRTHLMEKKKKEYPKTYEECCEILGYSKEALLCDKKGLYSYHINLLADFQKLLICRDAYWKIYGEDNDLGKPWEPDWSDYENIKYIIGGYDGEIGYDQNHHIHKILAFPTKEMRDAFKENFDPDIEICKEFL